MGWAHLGIIYRTNGRSWAGAERLAVGGTPSRRAACRGTVSVVCAGVAVAGGVRHVRPRLYWNGPLGASHAQAVPTGDPHPLPSRIPSLGDRRGHVRLLSNPPTRTHARGNLTFRRQDCWGSTRRGSAGDVPHRPAWKAPRSPGTLSGRLSIPVPWERSRLKAPTLLPRSSKDLGLLLFLTRRLGGRISRGSSGPRL